MLIILAASMTFASISGASEGGSSFKRQDKILIFSSVTLVTQFLMVMVMLLDFHGQEMCQGHHPESD